MRLQFIFIWTVLMTSTARCTDSVTTCSTKPSSVHEDVILVCRFPEPVTQIGKDISVQRNEFNNASASAPSVLECPLSRRQDPGGCVAGAGYIFKGFSLNSNEVEIYIHNVSKEHEGSYTCQLVGHSSTIIPCNFTLGLILPEDRRNDVETSQSSVSSTFTTNITEDVFMHSNWLNQESGLFLNCTNPEGHAYPIIDGATATIGIPRAKKQQKGYYRCSVVNPAPNTGRHSCAFSVAESGRSDSGAISTEAIIAIAVACAVGFIVAVAVAVYWNWKRWKDQRRQRVPTSEHEAIEMNPENCRNTRPKRLPASARNLKDKHIVSKLAPKFEGRDRQAREGMHANVPRRAPTTVSNIA